MIKFCIGEIVLLKREKCAAFTDKLALIHGMQREGSTNKIWE